MSNQQNNPNAPALLLWFRFDLRLKDHPAVRLALEQADREGLRVIPLYVVDDGLGTRPLGAASRWWLGRSLRALSKDLEARGSQLILKSGDAHEAIIDLVQSHNIKAIHAAHSFDPVTMQKDMALEKRLSSMGVGFERANATHFAIPNALKTQTGGPYRVFTPFYRALEASGVFEQSAQLDDSDHTAWPSPETWPQSFEISQLKLEETHTASGKDWAVGFDVWQPGEAGALRALDRFLDNGLKNYADGRDRPDLDVTSGLSPHLRFGEISPQRIISELNRRMKDDSRLQPQAQKFRSELAWREFSYGLLAQQPRLHEINFKSEFNDFPWTPNDSDMRRWTRGHTGYGLVDAGMKQLWRTGFMHNRVRMVAASFLIKHLMIDWRQGEAWFWDTLLDADPANNPASWQWVAGSGADAAPYFRVFNPISQAEKFDPKGLYRSRYLENAASDGNDLFAAISPPLPTPMINHEFARHRALLAYESWRKESNQGRDPVSSG